MEDQKASGFIEQPHTADRALKVWAPDYFSLLSEAARGMYTLMGIVTAASAVTGEAPIKRVEIVVTGEDQESWLVAFLTELLYLSEQAGLAFREFSFLAEGQLLRVNLTGVPLLAVKKEIKAVTYHYLAIIQSEGHLETTIVFDV
jgi:SHS2 domain-containing protein